MNTLEAISAGLGMMFCLPGTGVYHVWKKILKRSLSANWETVLLIVSGLVTAALTWGLPCLLGYITGKNFFYILALILLGVFVILALILAWGLKQKRLGVD